MKKKKNRDEISDVVIVISTMLINKFEHSLRITQIFFTDLNI